VHSPLRGDSPLPQAFETRWGHGRQRMWEYRGTYFRRAPADHKAGALAIGLFLAGLACRPGKEGDPVLPKVKPSFVSLFRPPYPPVHRRKKKLCAFLLQLPSSAPVPSAWKGNPIILPSFQKTQGGGEVRTQGPACCSTFFRQLGSDASKRKGRCRKIRRGMKHNAVIVVTRKKERFGRHSVRYRRCATKKKEKRRKKERQCVPFFPSSSSERGGEKGEGTGCGRGCSPGARGGGKERGGKKKKKKKRVTAERKGEVRN